MSVENPDAPQEATADAGREAPQGPSAGPRRLWIIGGAVLGLIAAIAGGAWLLRPRPAPTVPAATAHQAVQGFLDAVAVGDADLALKYALIPPTDTSLLTRDLLEAAHREAPLKVVRVPQAEGAGTTVVPAEVLFGADAATIAFNVTDTPEGWRLNQVTSIIDPGALPADLGVQLNGRPLPNPAHIEVFPGVYTFTETLREIDLAGKRVVVGAVGEDVKASLGPTLTDRGRSQATSRAKAALTRCLKLKQPAPENCPNMVTETPDQKIDAKTIKWNLKGDPWKRAAYTLDPAAPTQLRGASDFTFRFRCKLKQAGDTYTVDQTFKRTIRFSLVVTDPRAGVAWQS